MKEKLRNSDMLIVTFFLGGRDNIMLMLAAVSKIISSVISYFFSFR